MDHKQIKILSTNISTEKGTIKKPVAQIELNDYGVKNDAHAGSWHRQVSMLGTESFKKFSEIAGREIAYGEFAENITTEGMELFKTTPLDRFSNHEIELEVTQIGKKCHGDSCAIFREVGNCVMPKEGIFVRVIKGGALKTGDILEYHPKIFKTLIITLSDRASKGEYADKSGPKVKEALETFAAFSHFKLSIENVVIADDASELKNILKGAKESYDFIFTTGGTGIGPRDITVDVVKPLLDKEIPGIMDMIRMKYGMEKPNALISRSIAGLMNNTMIFVLPGSVKAVNEYMSEITKILQHLVLMLYSIDAH
ncbi:MAG: molybdenum cofactor synthesis domain-containing protein [Bacteroidales bacterium]|jgi:molybdenum cofactor synthesis domain-containing protein|nr:molybdenum cofactor synthesis domain-containing protein [Bacteroidales bacterium]